jgi:hypothetical protein
MTPFDPLGSFRRQTQADLRCMWAARRRSKRRPIENQRLVLDCERQVRKQAAGIHVASFLFVISFFLFDR